MNVNDRTLADGWPEDERPIFIDSGFGTVSPRSRGDRPLTEGARVSADAGATEFAEAWSTILDAEPDAATGWEYAVQDPDALGDEAMTRLPLPDALDRVRVTPGARLRRRPVGRWDVVATPFPRERRAGWAELEDSKAQWHAAFNEFPPSYSGIISRMGGVTNAPEEWTQYARRAAAAGFTPADYRMLATAHLAWKALEEKKERGLSIPDLATIEAWAAFPERVREGLSLIEAVGDVAKTLR